MASIASGQAYETAFYILTGTSATDIYTVGDSGEEEMFLTGLLIVDSTGAVNTPATAAIRRSGTNYVLFPATFGLPTPSENLEFICEPAIRMFRGDTVRVTGASGHHCFVSYVPVGKGTGQIAQR